MNNNVKNAPSLMLPLLITSCSILGPNEGVPIAHSTQKASEGIDVIAVTASRRMAYAKLKTSPWVTCSEPPPDAAQAFAESLAAAVKADRDLTGSANGSTIGAKFGNSVGAGLSYASAVAGIYQRSQGVQLFRDGTFALCQAFMNQAKAGDPIAELQAKVKDQTGAELDRIQSTTLYSQLLRGQTEIDKNTIKQLFPDVNIKPSNSGSKPTSVPKTTPEAASFEAENLYTASFRELLAATKEVLLEEVKYMYVKDHSFSIINPPVVNIALDAPKTTATDAPSAPKAGASGTTSAPTNQIPGATK